MKNAAMDVGSNSILLYIEDNGKSIYDTGEITKLGSELALSGKIGKKSFAESLAVIKKYYNICKDFGVYNIYAAGTMALRNASNADDFINKVKEETGIIIEVLSGEEEAQLSYTGACSTAGDKESVKMVIDIGGGSTEFICGKGDEIISVYSLNIGILKVTNEYFFEPYLKENDYIRCENNLKKTLQSLNIPGFDILIGAGGSITNLASVKLGFEKFDAGKINGLILNKKDITDLISLFTSLSLEEREKLNGLQKGRASTITAGAAIALSAMQNLKSDSLIVSTKGLRHGLLIQKRGTN
jgi:exopolyphosphatase/guanosine-5'-triphosphate,3'-diphosphate pyrophosphatase